MKSKGVFVILSLLFYFQAVLAGVENSQIQNKTFKECFKDSACVAGPFKDIFVFDYTTTQEKLEKFADYLLQFIELKLLALIQKRQEGQNLLILFLQDIVNTFLEINTSFENAPAYTAQWVEKREHFLFLFTQKAYAISDCYHRNVGTQAYRNMFSPVKLAREKREGESSRAFFQKGEKASGLPDLDRLVISENFFLLQAFVYMFRAFICKFKMGTVSQQPVFDLDGLGAYVTEDFSKTCHISHFSHLKFNAYEDRIKQEVLAYEKTLNKVCKNRKYNLSIIPKVLFAALKQEVDAQMQEEIRAFFSTNNNEDLSNTELQTFSPSTYSNTRNFLGNLSTDTLKLGAFGGVGVLGTAGTLYKLSKKSSNKNSKLISWKTAAGTVVVLAVGAGAIYIGKS